MTRHAVRCGAGNADGVAPPDPPTHPTEEPSQMRNSFSLAVGLALVCAATASAQQSSVLPGDYDLRGTYADGRTTKVDLEVELERNGQLKVTRKAKRAGEKLEWTGVGNPNGTQLQVEYRVPTSSAGAAGRVSGATGGSVNVLRAVYVISVDGRTISEDLRNTTQLAPEDGWSSLTTAGTRDLDHLSYGELAANTIPHLFEDLVGKLGAFGPATLPHEAKQLRKDIGKLRIYLDLFSYAYPRGMGFDPWKDIRDELDDGYEWMGEFKDLFDAQGVDAANAVYDPAEVTQLRDRVLGWLGDFTRSGHLAFVRYYLGHPKKRTLYSRSKKDLSRYYWGVGGSKPKKSKTGLENLASLQRALLDAARDELKEVVEIKDDELIVYEEQESFHDFRKALRSTIKISDEFPEIYDEDASAEILFVDGVVDRFGDINDDLIAHALAVKRGQNNKADDIADRVEAAWDALKKWIDQEDVDDEIHDLRKKVDH